MSNMNRRPCVMNALHFTLLFLRYCAIVFCLPVAGLILDHWWHGGASILCNAWLISVIVICCMKRPPCHYSSFEEWYADRANWWKARL